MIEIRGVSGKVAQTWCGIIIFPENEQLQKYTFPLFVYFSDDFITNTILVLIQEQPHINNYRKVKPTNQALTIFFYRNLLSGMKKIVFVIFVCGLAAYIFYTNNLQHLRASVGQITDSSPLARLYTDQKHITRLRQGDTTILAQTELINLLPPVVAGYQSYGVPDGSLVNLMGNRYTVAERYYRKGNQQLKLAIADYNAAYTLYNVATSTLDTGIIIRNTDQISRTLTLGIEDATVWETYDKREHKAMVSVGVAERFLITVEASGQSNTEEARAAICSLDLRTLLR